MNKCSITYREAEVLKFIITFQKKNGFSPTFREIAEHLGVKGRGTVQRATDRLRDLGYISWTKYKNRGMTIHV